MKKCVMNLFVIILSLAILVGTSLPCFASNALDVVKMDKNEYKTVLTSDSFFTVYIFLAVAMIVVIIFILLFWRRDKGDSDESIDDVELTEHKPKH